MKQKLLNAVLFVLIISSCKSQEEKLQTDLGQWLHSKGLASLSMMQKSVVVFTFTADRSCSSCIKKLKQVLEEHKNEANLFVVVLSNSRKIARLEYGPESQHRITLLPNENLPKNFKINSYPVALLLANGKVLERIDIDPEEIDKSLSVFTKWLK